MAKQMFYLNPNGGPEFYFGSTAAASKYFRKHHRNIAEGFYDRKGVFHPIRASSDYSSSRAGEGKRRRKAKKSRKRKHRR